MYKTRILTALLLVFCLTLVCCTASASRVEPDSDGTTPPLEHSTELADGIYTPDSFSFSGGTGKVKIACPEVTVQDGLSYATIHFSSSSYSYVKINGHVYYAEISGKNAVFEIPIALNQNNTIYALTTKMSTPHEIEYTLLVSLSADGIQASQSDELDNTPPEITGFPAGEAVPMKHSTNLKLFRYADSLLLFEIDTLRDPIAHEPIPEEELTPADQTAALYQKRVLKYLAYPQGLELPAGTEKQYILIPLPVSGVYAADAATLQRLHEYGFSGKIAASGIENGPGVFADRLDALNYRALILNQVHTAFAGSSAAPLLGSSLTDRFATLGIALIVDMSTEQDAQDWAELYQLLLCE